MMKKYLEKVYNKTQKDFFILLKEHLDKNKKMFIVTANPETMIMGLQNQELNDVLVSDDVMITPDGIGVVRASGAVNNQATERITGVDISKFLIEYGNETNKSIYLYGAKPEVIDAFANKLSADYPNLVITGKKDGYNNNDDDIMNDVLEKKPDILLIALGIPRQEILIHKYFDKMEKGICVGVGGTFDVLSGMKKRAPKFFIKCNIEWLYRIIKEPKRFKRFYASNVKFLKEVKKIKREYKNEKN